MRQCQNYVPEVRLRICALRTANGFIAYQTYHLRYSYDFIIMTI